MAAEIKVLFVGLGSIGTRHLNNLADWAKAHDAALTVDALRSSIARPLRPGVEEQIHQQFIDTASLGHYDVIFITNPTSLHDEVLYWLKGKADTLFIEKPIFDGVNYDLKKLGLSEGQKAYVAAPMRWCGVMQELKRHPELLKPYCVRAICSSYLPDWRPGVDYRKVYSAHKEMGGGVSIDLIHELDYLVDLFGIPTGIQNMRGKFSSLEIDSEDLSLYMARYPGMLAEVHLDYFGRTYRRTLELFGEDGTAEADFGKGTLTLPDGSVIDCAEDVNERYRREMEYFMDYALNGSGESVNSPRLAMQVLRLAGGRV